MMKKKTLYAAAYNRVNTVSNFRWPAIWKRIEWECYKNEDSIRKSHSMTQASDTLKKVAMLTKTECTDCG